MRYVYNIFRPNCWHTGSGTVANHMAFPHWWCHKVKPWILHEWGGGAIVLPLTSAMWRSWFPCPPLFVGVHIFQETLWNTNKRGNLRGDIPSHRRRTSVLCVEVNSDLSSARWPRCSTTKFVDSVISFWTNCRQWPCNGILLLWLITICTVTKDIVTWRLKAGIVKPEEKSIARQRLGKHVSSTTPIIGNIGERRCFLLDPPQGYITRTPGQLRWWLKNRERELRSGSSVVKERVRLWREDFTCAEATVRLI
jgi:hypothetical protein